MELLEKVKEDDRRRGPANTYLVLLGDLVDRGPDSRGVLETFVSAPQSFAKAVFLKGNHEEFVAQVLSGDDKVTKSWLNYGGYEFAESYGISRGWSLNASATEVTERLMCAVPKSHKDFIEQMADSFRFGDYLFVHAGIRPGIEIDDQASADLRWIREGFLDDRTDHGFVVVHGHTIVERAEEHPNRIALDTGAYRSGLLTALGLEGTERWFIEARSEVASSASET